MYILEMVEERRALQDFERHDLFSKMLASCDEEVGFTEDDLFGKSSVLLSRFVHLTLKFLR
jgi:hypothetical protein